MSILKALYDGELYPAERILSDDPVYREGLRQSDEIEKVLRAALTPAQCGLLDRFSDAEHALAEMDAYASFEYGFRLCALFARELDSKTLPRL